MTEYPCFRFRRVGEAIRPLKTHFSLVLLDSVTGDPGSGVQMLLLLNIYIFVNDIVDFAFHPDTSW